jgi:uncharacterized membrane protein
MTGAILLVITIVLGLAFLTVVGAAVGVVVPRLMPGKPSPEAILRERYARGEITAEQFEEMRRRLTAGTGPTSRAA